MRGSRPRRHGSSLRRRQLRPSSSNAPLLGRVVHNPPGTDPDRSGLKGEDERKTNGDSPVVSEGNEGGSEPRSVTFTPDEPNARTPRPGGTREETAPLASWTATTRMPIESIEPLLGRSKHKACDGHVHDAT
eukprot:scaffold25_cov342-Pavlova_lutheri.AAC.57